LVQVATQVFPFFNIPNWSVRLVVVVLAIGFPVAVLLAWVYEITPEGVRRTEPADSPAARPEYASRQIGRKLNTVIIAVLVLAVALLGWRLLVLRHAASPAAPRAIAAAQAQHAGNSTATATVASAPAAPAAFHPPADTLVVLPFANLGGDPKQQYFSDGITEELTNALGQNTGLRVIAWDTASKFRHSKQSAAEIGKQLNVANVLTGKILRQDNEVRVIVELVDTRNGYQVWASHYDDNLKNIFQVQDKISASIADALKVKFAAANTSQTVNPEAHDLVLKARAVMQTARTAAPYEQVRSFLEQAIAIAPDYADAHALLARTLDNLTQFTTLPLKDILPKVREEASKALQLDPDNVDAILALANADLFEGRNTDARKGFQRAIELDPSNAAAHLDYGLLLPPKEARAETLESARLDPDNAATQNNLATQYMDLGEYQNALAPGLALVKLAPHSVSAAFGLAQNYALLHRDRDAVEAFDLVYPETALGKQLAAAGKLAYQSILDSKLRPQALAAADTLRKRSDLDPDSLYNLFMVYLVLDEKGVALDLLDRSCAPTPFSCNDFAVNPTYIPLRGDPRFEALERKYAAPAQSAASTASIP
ncbi:MAG TPA: tetratricopeptide repeat protein, partial [Rhodanobacteraceae bacterium]|nr:tetratricopeptide repeat protein [Rhodanobacteraceae bacterium]